jgi:hypothetical protein
MLASDVAGISWFLVLTLVAFFLTEKNECLSDILYLRGTGCPDKCGQ